MFESVINGMKFYFTRNPQPELSYDVQFAHKGDTWKITLKQDESGMFKIAAQGGIPVHIQASELDLNDAIYDNEGMTPPSSFVSV